MSELALNYHKVHKYKFTNEMLDYVNKNSLEFYNEIETNLGVLDQSISRLKTR